MQSYTWRLVSRSAGRGNTVVEVGGASRLAATCFGNNSEDIAVISSRLVNVHTGVDVNPVVQ